MRKSSGFRVITAAPLNGSPAPADLARQHITPTAEFFVRNHGDVPRQAVSPALAVLLEGGPRTTVEATLQCAGNRRSGLRQVRDVPSEIPWGNEAIGNAVWGGVSLAAVLEAGGIPAHAAHVWFLGADKVTGKGAGERFGASIPLVKALSPEVILADTMNGIRLAPEHGGPVRVIVPGYIGARSVKWLSEIRVEREPTPNYFQRAYSVIPPGHEPAGGRVLGELVVNSAFANPADGDAVARSFTARGWAIASGDAVLERVDISPDDGATWLPARFASPAKRFVWRLWECDLTLRPGTHTLACRAFDSRGQSQPADPRDIWNVKGYENNSWDRITVGG